MRVNAAPRLLDGRPKRCRAGGQWWTWQGRANVLGIVDNGQQPLREAFDVRIDWNARRIEQG